MATLQKIELVNSETNTQVDINTNGAMQVVKLVLLAGDGFSNTLDTYRYSSTPVGTGAVTIDTCAALLNTGVTANSSISIVSTQRARCNYGKINMFLSTLRLNTFAADNITEWGIQLSGTDRFGFRQTGSEFGVFINKGGVDTYVSSANFTGVFQTGDGAFTQNNSFNDYVIHYSQARISFWVNGSLLHEIKAVSTILPVLCGKAFITSTNINDSITDVTRTLLGLVIYSEGDVVNSPLFHNYSSGENETVTLKNTAGVLQAVSITKSGAGGTLTVYDNTAGSGTVIAIFDLNAPASVANHTFGTNGINFSNGLTYVVAGTPTNASFTILWE